MSEEQTLFEKYGIEKISECVFKSYEKVMESPTLAPYFKNVDMNRLVDHQIAFSSRLMGGPDEYNGRSLSMSHKRFKITEEAFDEFSGLLVTALAESGIEEPDIHALGALLMPARSDIVSA